MKIEFKELPIILNKLGISVSQFLFLIMVHEKLYASMYAYDVNNVGFTQEELEDLMGKGYIANIREKDKYEVDNFVVTEKFQQAFYSVNAESAGEEFWDKFPSYISFSGKQIPAKTLDKEKFIKDYQAKVGKYQIMHQNVMEALDYAVQHNLICMGLEKWFLSEQWNEVLKLKAKSKVNGHFPSEHVF